MIGFKDYLEEAKITERNLDRAAALMMKVVQRRLSMRITRVGSEPIKNGGKGLMFITSKKGALRINYIKGEIHSVSIWDLYKFFKPADRTVLLNGINLVQVVDELAEIIKNQAYVGKKKVYALEESHISDEDMLMEAKQVKPDAFIDALLNLYAGNDLFNVKWSEIETVAANNDWKIPGAVRKLGNKKIKGQEKTFNLTSLKGEVKDSGKPIAPVEMEVVRKDTVTVDDKGAHLKPLLKKMKAGVQTDEEAAHDAKVVDTLFYKMSKLVEFVVRGATAALVIYGGPGIGKTFVTKQVLKEEGVFPDKNTVFLTGKATAADVYKALYKFRKDGDLIVFDDLDSLWKDQDAVNVLKGALDTQKVREISWLTSRNMDVTTWSDDQKREYESKLDADIQDGKTTTKYPNMFQYRGSVIFISNLSGAKFDTAILSRASNIDMDMTASQIFLRMRNILEFMQPDDAPELSMDKKLEIFEKLKEIHYREAEMNENVLLPSLRMMDKAMKIVAYGYDDWEMFLDNL